MYRHLVIKLSTTPFVDAYTVTYCFHSQHLELFAKSVESYISAIVEIYNPMSKTSSQALSIILTEAVLNKDGGYAAYIKIAQRIKDVKRIIITKWLADQPESSAVQSGELNSRIQRRCCQKDSWNGLKGEAGGGAQPEGNWRVHMSLWMELIVRELVVSGTVKRYKTILIILRTSIQGSGAEIRLQAKQQ
ncbi:conserved hypothetical protein [Ricinus communis]|uniref:Uncharacterized protein n=1 Tax=Ricinus communis TaxID=3988 RepID=B9SI08_RICCO|nr:conserved hypothetical protein [Ricinus communis]